MALTTEKKSDTKLGSGQDGGKVQIVVKCQDESTIRFQMQRSGRFESLFRTFYMRKGLEYGTVQFVHNGVRVQRFQSPAELELEEEEHEIEIEAFATQIGGGLGD